MKKVITLIMSVLMCIALFSGCSNDSGPASTTESVKTEPEVEEAETMEETSSTKNTAEEILQALIDAELPIGTTIVYTEETDVNNLLGRPNQYTSKVNFADTRLDQYDEANNPVGGTIEVFETDEDATARKEYVEALNEISKQYIYQFDTTVVRLDFELTPSQAEEYTSELETILNT